MKRVLMLVLIFLFIFGAWVAINGGGIFYLVVPSVLTPLYIYKFFLQENTKL